MTGCVLSISNGSKACMQAMCVAQARSLMESKSSVYERLSCQWGGPSTVGLEFASISWIWLLWIGGLSPRHFWISSSYFQNVEWLQCSANSLWKLVTNLSIIQVKKTRERFWTQVSHFFPLHSGCTHSGFCSLLNNHEVFSLFRRR